jgi:excisionase family DNA binding protein
MMLKRLLNVDEAAEYTGIKKNTLYSWVCQRRVPFVKCGSRTMFDIKDLERWIEANKTEENKIAAKNDIL